MVSLPRKLKVGYIGSGNVVRRMHIPVALSLPDKFEIAGCVDIDLEKARETCAQAGVGKPYGSLAEMKAEHPDLDFVTIATKPYSTHTTLAIEALETGCHVYVEKPFAVSLKDAQQMFATAERCGKSCVAYQNRRFEVSCVAFKQALDEGILGELRLIRRHMTRGIKCGDLLNFGTHEIDQMIYLTNAAVPVEVSAIIQVPEVEYDGPAGFFKLALRYESGLMAEVELLPNSDQVNYYYAAGVEGSYYQDWADSMADLFRKQRKLTGADVMWYPNRFDELFPNIFQLDGRFYYMCYTKLYDHLVNGAPPPVRPEETRLQFRIIEAMFKSAREKRTVTLS